MKLMRVIAPILALCIVLLSALPVLAITNPTSVNIDKTHATSNVLETGDILFMAEYEINYTSTPTEIVSESFIFRLMDTDGTTELGRVLAFPYINSGYGLGVVSFYFNAATAPGTDQYIIQILGNPAVFTSSFSQNFTLPVSTYTALSADTDTDIRLQVLNEYIIDLDPTYEAALGAFLSDTATGTKTTLTPDGEVYFTNAIINLRNMSPSLFQIEELAPVGTTDSYNTTQADAYKARFVGNWVEDSTAALGDLLNTDMQIAMGIIVAIICILFAVASQFFVGSSQASFLPIGVVLLGGTVLGFVSMALMSIIVLIAGLYVGMILIMRGMQV